jgi:hypothetical protein
MQQPMYMTRSWGTAPAARWCEVCGCSPCRCAPIQSGMDMIAQMSQAFFVPLMESLNQMVASTLAPSRVTRTGHAHSYRKAHNYDCSCHCDDWARSGCHCRCCIGDADLAVYARLGERRVVPIVVENSRRRERQISLELSGWTTRSGKPTEVTAHLQPPTEFTLAPCEERVVVLEVNATGRSDTPSSTDVSEKVGLPDVDECEVVYADLRVTGCDIRPIRIALALLPRDCAAYEARCQCGCC